MDTLRGIRRFVTLCARLLTTGNRYYFVWVAS